LRIKLQNKSFLRLNALRKQNEGRRRGSLFSDDDQNSTLGGSLVQKKICKERNSLVKCFATLLALSILSSPTTYQISTKKPFLETNILTSSASVAPLADVGLREYLVKDGSQILRLSLPTSIPLTSDPEKNGDVGRVAQEAAELIRLRFEQVGYSGKKPLWIASNKDVARIKSSLGNEVAILKNIPADKKNEARALLDLAIESTENLGIAVKNENIEETLKHQSTTAQIIGEIRSLSLQPNALPYNIPSEFENMPRLQGRATVECIIVKKQGEFRLSDGSTSSEAILTIVLDGYHAPLTSGNFLDLVVRKFYNQMPIQAVDELFVKTGKPTNLEDGKIDGFIDPSTKEKRSIPLELFYKKDREPTYGYTSDDDMRATESFVLPFQAYGAIGMAHDAEEVNDASSQFFFLKWNQDLVTPGRNTIDGSNCCFGYIVKNQDLLEQISVGDVILNIRLVDGEQNFKGSI